MINDNNFYKEFDLLYDQLNINNDEIYSKFIELYENYAFKYKSNDILNNELKTTEFEIDSDGLLKNIAEL